MLHVLNSSQLQCPMSELLKLLKRCILLHSVGAMTQPHYIARHVAQGGIYSVQGQRFGYGTSVSMLERNAQCGTTIRDRRQICRRQAESHTGFNRPSPRPNKCSLFAMSTFICTLVDTVDLRLIRTSQPCP